MRYYRTTALMPSQMQELACLVHQALAEPWNKGTGRPKSCGLYAAMEIACMYLRQNSTQEFLGDMRHVSQPTVSRIVTTLVPVVKAVLEEFVPAAEDAIEMANGRVCLVDGTITPCWSYADHDELWSRKHGTTGFNAQLVCLLDGNAIYISDPLPGKTHDAAAFAGTPAAEIVWTRRARNRRTASLSHGKRNTMPMSRRCGRQSKGLSRILSPGGSSTLTTAARTAPTVTRMMPHAHCSSARSHGVLNNPLSLNHPPSRWCRTRAT